MLIVSGNSPGILLRCNSQSLDAKITRVVTNTEFTKNENATLTEKGLANEERTYRGRALLQRMDLQSYAVIVLLAVPTTQTPCQ